MQIWIEIQLNWSQIHWNWIQIQLNWSQIHWNWIQIQFKRNRIQIVEKSIENLQIFSIICNYNIGKKKGGF
jgi:hypothetical protein